jgi:hypothetical protein
MIGGSKIAMINIRNECLIDSGTTSIILKSKKKNLNSFVETHVTI